MSHSPFVDGLSSELVASSRVQVIASGIDALYLSGRVHLVDSLLERLESAKARAQASGEAVPFEFSNVVFDLAPHGWGRYPYRLAHKYGLVGLTGSSQLPAVRVQLRADFIHGLGAEAAAQAFVDLLTTALGSVELTVSRVDLFADVEGWDLGAEDRARFVTRAIHRDTFEEHGLFRGLLFGRRKGGGLSARIYDKTAELAKGGATWLLDEWGKDHDPAQRVLRVEFEYGRAVLRGRGVNTLHDLFGNLGGLWAYATEEWLSLRSVGADETRSRLKVAPEWVAISQAALRGGAVGLERVAQTTREAALRQVRNGLRGYSVSYAALNGVRDSAVMGQCLTAELKEHEKLTGNPFGVLAERRCQQRGWCE